MGIHVVNGHSSQFSMLGLGPIVNKQHNKSVVDCAHVNMTMSFVTTSSFTWWRCHSRRHDDICRGPNTVLCSLMTSSFTSSFTTSWMLGPHYCAHVNEDIVIHDDDVIHDVMTTSVGTPTLRTGELRDADKDTETPTYISTHAHTHTHTHTHMNQKSHNKNPRLCTDFYGDERVRERWESSWYVIDKLVIYLFDGSSWGIRYTW